MGSKHSKQKIIPDSYHTIRGLIINQRTFEELDLAAVSGIPNRTGSARIQPAFEEIMHTIPTDAVSIQPVPAVAKEREDESAARSSADAASIFSDLSSLKTDFSSAVDNLGSNPDNPPNISPDSGCNSDFRANSREREAPLPTKRKRNKHLESAGEPSKPPEPKLEAGKFESSLWVPVEDVARVFANPKDRRIEAIARACNCQFVLTDTHRLTKMLGVQQLVCVFSNVKTDLEKCRNIIDDKFPAFYIKSTSIVDRQSTVYWAYITLYIINADNTLNIILIPKKLTQIKFPI